MGDGVGKNGRQKGDMDILARQELLTRSEFLDVALSVMGIEDEPRAEPRSETGASGSQARQQYGQARKFRSRPPGL